ncbi:MAG: CPBP family intramembrane glutamic endopeptidase [Halolamina sp.]
MPSTPLETRRIGAFLLVTFGVSWMTGAVLWATGGLVDSPEVVGPLTLAALLLPTAYMFGPAVGNVAARLLTGEGKRRLMLRPDVDGAVRTYAAMWLLPAALTVVGGATYFLAFPSQFSPGLSQFRTTLASAGAAGLDARTVAAIQILAAVTVAPLLNVVVTFGEEFGWRAYLLPKLRPLGERRAAVAVGVVWGVWHWPIIAMGHNYGLDYPGAPWTGMVAFVAFTVSVGVLLAWATLREGSVWSAALGHGAVNAGGGLPLLFLGGSSRPLLGPAPTGLLAVVPFVAAAGWLLARSPTLAGD